MCFSLSRFVKKHSGYSAVFLRLAVGAIFAYHGYGKLLTVGGVAATQAFFQSFGIPGFLAVPIGVVELVGGLFLAAGLFTRYAALLLSGVMVVAIAVVKQPWSNGFGNAEVDIALLGACMALVLLGGQKLSVDNDVIKKEF